MIEQCFEGWSSAYDNTQRRCCCNCQHQQPIVGHPWNKHELTKTPMTKIIGWGCHGPELYPIVTFMDGKHGMCEMHEFRTERADALYKEVESRYGNEARVEKTED